jgi:cytoskeleton protein RodZ
MSTHNTSGTNREPEIPHGGALVSPGDLLRAAREQAQLTQREVADKLHLLPSQVAALEENRFEYFNAEIFCKGYLRSYGKLIGVSPETLIDAYLKLRPSPPLRPERTSQKVTHVQSPGKGRSIQYWCVAVMMAVVIGLWAMSGGSEDQPSLSLLDDERLLTVDERDRSLLNSLAKSKKMRVAAADVSPVANESESSNAMLSGQLNETTTNSDVNHTEPVAMSGSVVVADPVPALVSTSVPALVSTSVPALVSTSVPTSISTSVKPVLEFDSLERDKPDVLSFRFSGDCWVQVTDSDNKVLVADLKRAEDVLKLHGRAPFKVVLGYAPAVSLQYNGELVTINSNTRSNTAKIVIGQS